MKEKILITPMATDLSETVEQTPINKTRSDNDYSQVDNYLVALKCLGIPTSDTDNLDAPGLPQNTVKIIFNTALGKLRVYNPVTETWADAGTGDLANYLPLTGGTINGYVEVLGGQVKLGRVETFLDAAQSSIAGFHFKPTVGVGDETPEPELQLRYGSQTGLDGLYVGLESEGYTFKRLLRDGDALPITGGALTGALSITNEEGTTVLNGKSINFSTWGEINGNVTFANGIYGHGPVDIWTGLNSGRLTVANSMARLQHKNPDGTGIAEVGAYSSGDNGQIQLITGSVHGQRAINIESPQPEGKGITVTDQVNGTGIQYSDDSDWANLLPLGLIPKKYADNNFLKLTGGTLSDDLTMSSSTDANLNVINPSTGSYTSLRNEGLVFYKPGSGAESYLYAPDITAEQHWALPNATGTLSLKSDLDNYLQLTGGTLTGDVTAPAFYFPSGAYIVGNDKNLSYRLNDPAAGHSFMIDGINAWNISKNGVTNSNGNTPIFNNEFAGNLLTNHVSFSNGNSVGVNYENSFYDVADPMGTHVFRVDGGVVMAASVLNGIRDAAGNKVLVEGDASQVADTITSAPTPISSGVKGKIIVTGGYRYECINTDTWVRSAVETIW